MKRLVTTCLQTCNNLCVFTRVVLADEAKFNTVCKLATNLNINDVRRFWPFYLYSFVPQDVAFINNRSILSPIYMQIMLRMHQTKFFFHHARTLIAGCVKQIGLSLTVLKALCVAWGELVAR